MQGDDSLAAARELSRRLQRARTDPRREQLLRLALDLCRAGRYAEAEEVSRLELQHAAESAPGAVALATALLGQGRVRDAAAEAVKVLRREPSFVPAHRILGKALLMGGRADLAIDVLLRARQMSPQDPWISLLLREAEDAVAASAPVPTVEQRPASGEHPAASVEPARSTGPREDGEQREGSARAAHEPAVSASETRVSEEQDLGGAEPASPPAAGSPGAPALLDDDLQAAAWAPPSREPGAPIGETGRFVGAEPDDAEDRTTPTREALALEDTEPGAVVPGSVEDGEDDVQTVPATASPLAEEDGAPESGFSGSERTAAEPAAPARLPLDAPRPRQEGSPHYATGIRPSSAITLRSGDFEIITSASRLSPMLSLEDSLQRAEAILDTLGEAEIPDSLVFSAPPGSSSAGLPDSTEPGPFDFGDESTRPLPSGEPYPLEAEPLPYPLIPLVSAHDAPTEELLDRTVDERRAPRATGSQATPLPQARRQGSAPPISGQYPAGMAEPLELFPRRVARDLPEIPHGARWSSSSTGRWLGSVTSRLRRRSVAFRVAAPIIALLLCWASLVAWHRLDGGRSGARLAAARQQLQLRTYAALLRAEQELAPLGEQRGSGRSLLDALADAAVWVLGLPGLHEIREDGAARLILVRALLVARFGVARPLPPPTPLPPDASPLLRAARAMVLLAQNDVAGALALLPQDLASSGTEPELLRVQVEALGRAGELDRALALLTSLRPEARLPGDQLLLGWLLEDRNPGRALEAYSEAARQPENSQAEVLRARLRLREGLSIADERERMEQILADASGSSPRDRAWAAANLAQLERAGKDRDQVRRLLRRAIQLDPAETVFRLQAAELDLEDLELARAKQLLEAALQGSPACAPCRVLLAEVQLARGDAAAALELLEGDAPRTARTSYLRGKAFFMLGRLQEADDHLAAAQTQQKGQLESAALLGLVQVLLGNRKAGMESLHALERARPREPRVLLALAAALRHQGQTEQARGHLSEALRVDPQCYECWTELCQLEIQTAFGGPALTACQSAVRANPSYITAWVLIGQIHEAEGRTGDAEAAYRKVLQQLPGDVVAHTGLITCALAQDRDPDAARLLSEVAPLLGPAADYYRGLLAERAGKLDEAAVAFQRAASLPKLSRKAKSALGRVFLAQGKEVQARLALEQAARGDEGDTGAHLLLGDLALKADRLEDAANHYQTSLMLLDRRLHRVEDEAAALYGLGEAFFRMGNAYLGSARIAFQRAASADPRDGSSRLRLGEISELEGNAERAKTYYREAIQVDPDLVRAYWALGRLLEQRGEKEGARHALQEYLKRMPSGGNVQEAHILLEKLGR